MIVDLFIPCFVDQFYPETGLNIIKILKKLGIEYHYNPKQTCCGQPAFNSGYAKDALIMAKKFVSDFPHDRFILTPSASCAGYIRNHYKGLSKSPDFQIQAERLERNVVELTDFLVNKIGVLDFQSQFKGKVTWHSACSALREYKLKDEAQKLLSYVKDLELIPLHDNEVCCGFGGTFMLKFSSISEAMVEQKVEAALETGAEYILSTECSCLLNIESYIIKNKLPIKPLHIADVLACF